MNWGVPIIPLNKPADPGDNAVEKPLEWVEPRLYLKLRQGMEPYNLHSYDVKSGAVADENGITVFLRYGENLTHVQEHFFKWEEIYSDSTDISSFFHTVGGDIKKAVISDYFRMMKP